MPGPFPVDEQLPLGPTFHYAKQAGRLRALLGRAIAANGLSHAELEHETGVDERQIARCLRDDGGAHPPLALVACILAKDRQGIAIAGLAAMLGYEARPKIDPWDEVRRLRAKLARLEAALSEEP
jgi:hypothetical protein